jgi:hypothetical protein
MSIESLITTDPNFTQEACHDLESFLYIIIYICTFTYGPNDSILSNEVPLSCPLREWFKKTPQASSTGFIKAGHMLRPDIAILPYFNGYWEDMKPFVVELIETCFLKNPGASNHLTHDGMCAILKKAFNTVKEPEKIGSKRSYPESSGRHSKRGKQI